MPSEPTAHVQPHDDVLLIVVNRRSLNETSAGELTDIVQTEAAARLGVPIVLDLTQLKFAPSVALGTLVKLCKSFEFDGRRLALIGVDRRVRETMRTTNLDRVLEIHDRVEQVVSAPPKQR